MGSFPSHEKKMSSCHQAIQTPAEYLDFRPISLLDPWSQGVIQVVCTHVQNKFIAQYVHDYLGPPLRIIVPLSIKKQFWRRETFVMPMSDFLIHHRIGKTGQFHNTNVHFIITWKSCDLKCFGISFFNIDQYDCCSQFKRNFIFAPLKDVFRIRGEAICRTTDLNSVPDFCSVLVYTDSVNHIRISDVCPIDKNSAHIYDYEYSIHHFYASGDNIFPIFKSGFLQLPLKQNTI